jgi:hypothetical protein
MRQGLISINIMTRKYQMRRVFPCFLFFSILIILFLNLTYGTYFENYEPSLNAITADEFTSPITFFFFISTWFYIFPLFSLFNTFFHSVYGYSWGNTVFNVIILSSLLSCLYIILMQVKVKFTLVITAFLLFTFIYIDNIVLLQNLRISFFSLTASYLLIFLITRLAIGKLNYILAICLAVLGIFSRLEIAVITSLIMLCYSMLFQRQMLRFAALLFFSALSVFAFYKAYQHNIYPDQETTLEIEHLYEDKQSIKPEEGKDRRTQLLLYAVVMHIHDDDVFTVKDCARMVYSRSLTDYIRSDRFAGIYWGKLKELAFLLRVYIWLLILTVIFSSYTIYIYLKDKQRYIIASLKVFAFITFLLSVVLILSVLVNCPHNLIIAIWIAICLLCLFYLIFKSDEHRYITRFLFIFLIVFLIPLSFYHLYHLYRYEQQLDEKARNYRTMLLSLVHQKKTIVVQNDIDERNYPARLFSCLYNPKINQYYADEFLSRYPFFYKHNEEFFGKGYSSMGSKMNAIANHANVVYLSNADHNKFIAEYMRVFHKVKLTFTKYPTGVDRIDPQPYLVFSTPIEDIGNDK